MRVLPAVRSRVRKEQVFNLQLVQAGTHRRLKKPHDLVAIPLLPLVAATHGGKGDSAESLSQVPMESMLAAPSNWCPNPAHTSCLRVRGRSMMPLIHDGYIVVIDTSQTNHAKLYGQVIVAAHKEQGLVVSRLQRFDRTEVLVPENREYESTEVSSNGWRIVAKILWWIGLPG
jgi:SOS-response transcriptional repressor LexA